MGPIGITTWCCVIAQKSAVHRLIQCPEFYDKNIQKPYIFMVAPYILEPLIDYLSPTKATPNLTSKNTSFVDRDAAAYRAL
jgi:hypothetical protein